MLEPSFPSSSGHSDPLGYARPDLAAPRGRTGRRIGLIVAVLLAFLFLFGRLIPSINRPRVESNRVYCASNMRQIGQAIAMYANNHNGQFPDDLKTVLENEDLPTAVFVCPSSNDRVASVAATTQATAAGLSQPGHLSYLYLGKGLTNQTVTDDSVILYEPLTNHASAGMNVMFGDFHVEWLSAAEAATILKQVAAKRGIVRYPLTAATTAPSR